jgi:hypothetical protein
LTGQKKSLIYKVVNCRGKQYRGAIFSSLFVVYATLTTWLVPIIYSSMTLHFIYLLFLSAIAIWNGGVFYVEVFSKANERVYGGASGKKKKNK